MYRVRLGVAALATGVTVSTWSVLKKRWSEQQALVDQPAAKITPLPCSVSSTHDDTMRLMFVQILTRHGARAPTSRRSHIPESAKDLEWKCDMRRFHGALAGAGASNDDTRPTLPGDFVERRYGRDDDAWLPGDCALGTLTQTGFEMMRTLGAKLRRRYVDEAGLLPAELDADLLALRSTDYMRTIESAMGLLSGLYPSETRRNAKRPLTLNVREYAMENMYPRSDCKRLSEIREENEELEEVKRKRAEFDSNLRPLVHKAFEASGDYPRNWAGLYNMYQCLGYQGWKVPADMPADFEKRIHEAGAFEMFVSRGYTRDQVRLGVGRFVGELNEQLGRVARGEEKARFALYSGHDTTLTPVLNSMIRQPFHSPVGSYVAIELYADEQNGNEPYVRVVYNDRVMNILDSERDDGLVRLADFDRFARSITPDDYHAECVSKRESKKKK